MSRKGKNGYGIQPRHGKAKGEPEQWLQTGQASRAIKGPCVRRVRPIQRRYKETSKRRHRWEQEDHGQREGFN